jgi:hypothetical protein
VCGGSSHDHVLEPLVRRCGEQRGVEQERDIYAALVDGVRVDDLLAAGRQQDVDAIGETVDDNSFSTSHIPNRSGPVPPLS